MYLSFVSEADDCGVLLYERKTGKLLRKLPFSQEERTGNIYGKYLPQTEPSQVSYSFYEGNQITPDPYGKAFAQRKAYGQRQEETELKAYLPDEGYDWEADRGPQLPYEDCICYLLHIRGFTKHSSSGVKHKGTFLGLTEKLPYLKGLGITTLELQPSYEFLECSPEEELKKESPSLFLPEPEKAARGGTAQGRMAQGGAAQGRMAQGGAAGTAQGGEQQRPDIRHLNYWGYKKGFYYAPKAGYAAGKAPSAEFKDMIKNFHKNGMEIVMQFYFPKEIPACEMFDILRFWVTEYHVDGFRLIGQEIPADLLAQDALFSRTKLWSADFEADRVYRGRVPKYRNLALYRDDFMYDMRRFLKGDENMLGNVLYHMRRNPEKTGQINYFTNYYGFTMMDMVSFERKHNEENGEENRDGKDDNHTWNCGEEGGSRKQKIMALRMKQIRNALSMLFLSQGTPLLVMGDEFGHSQKGNNNPYCQDNETTWLNWKKKDKNKSLYEFAARLIRLRREHPILHRQEELRIMDTLSCGYPDLSYHGEAPWRPVTEPCSRQIGVMYCGKYALDKGEEDAYFYVALNMHWEAHTFALPKLPRGKEWESLIRTALDPAAQEAGGNKAVLSDPWRDRSREVPARSVEVFISRG
jgi:glycogen operon protein